MRVDLNSTVFAWEEFETSTQYVRDSFGLGVKNSEIYVFGGYIASIVKTVNDLLKLDTSSGAFTVITADGHFPSARSSPTMHLISSQIYLFGGQGMSAFYNDMWIYNMDSSQWSGVNQLGSIPGPRWRTAAHSQGDAIALWGGEGASGLLGDLYLYNSLTYSWTQLTTSSSQTPVAGKGACLIMDMPQIYLFGGLTEVGCLGQLWVYDIGSNQYTLLSSTGPQLAYISCQLRLGYFYVLFGQSAGEEPSGLVDRYDLQNNVWETLFVPDSSGNSSAQAIQMVVGSYVVRIGGEAWDLDPKNEVYVYDSTGPYLVGTIAEYIFLSGFIYYNTSFYSFGGSSVLGGSLRLSVPSQLFVRVDFSDICTDYTCVAPCSPGTVLVNSVCEKTPVGHYTEDFGSLTPYPCPAGTINEVQGATSSRQCYPCPNGYYSGNQGSSICLQCPTGFYCHIGSKVPTNLQQVNINNSTQPDLYSPPDTTLITLQFEVIVGVLMGGIIVMSIFWKRLNRKVRIIDLYPAMHNHQLERNMIMDKNAIGGIFSLLFITFTVLIIGAAIITYQLNNIQENKALVPLVILQSEVSDFVSSTIIISASFFMYGDSCAPNATCSSLIKVERNDIRFSSFSYVCELSNDKTCIITITCEQCIIDTGASLSLALQEKLSYSTGIYVNISSDSSIPGKLSSVAQSVYPSPGYMFIGSSPSQFFFTMTPSLFKSESSAWPRTSTGYHVSTENIPTEGSQYLSIELPITSQLKLEINLDKSISGLYTARVLKQNLLFVFSSLIGSVFGLLGAVGGVMHFFEGRFLKQKVINQKRKKMMKLRYKARKIKDILRDDGREKEEEQQVVKCPSNFSDEEERGLYSTRRSQQVLWPSYSSLIMPEGE